MSAPQRDPAHREPAAAGRWLEVNGAKIYGFSAWTVSSVHICWRTSFSSPELTVLTPLCYTLSHLDSVIGNFLRSSWKFFVQCQFQQPLLWSITCLDGCSKVHTSGKPVFLYHRSGLLARAVQTFQQDAGLSVHFPGLALWSASAIRLLWRATNTCVHVRRTKSSWFPKYWHNIKINYLFNVNLLVHLESLNVSWMLRQLKSLYIKTTA